MQWAMCSSGSSSGATKVGRSPDITSASIVLEWALRWVTTSLPAMGEREQRHVVALRGPVDQEPCALGPPGLGGEALSLEERSGLHSHVDAPRERRNVERERRLADRLPQARVGGCAALVAGNVKATGITSRVGAQGVEVGSVLLGRGGCRRPASDGETDMARVYVGLSGSASGRVASGSRVPCGASSRSAPSGGRPRRVAIAIAPRAGTRLDGQRDPRESEHRSGGHQRRPAQRQPDADLLAAIAAGNRGRVVEDLRHHHEDREEGHRERDTPARAPA